MKAKRIRVLWIALFTSMVVLMGCGEMLGEENSSGGGTGNGETTSAVTNEDNTTEETVTTTEETVTTTEEADKEAVGTEQQETESIVKANSTISIVIQARNVYCDDQLLVDNSIPLEDDRIKDTIGDFLETVKDNHCNVRLNAREADPDMENIVKSLLTELGIDYEIEGE